MKRTIRNQWKVALAAGVIASLGFLPQVRAELVYEPEVSPTAPMQVREQDREETRQALAESVKAQDTVQAMQAQPATAQPMSQPVAQPAQPVVQYVAQPAPATRYVAQQPIQQPQYQQPQYVTQQPVQQYVQAPAPTVVAPAQPVAVPVAVQVQPQVQVAPENATADATAQPQPEVESLSKAELLRRERMRTELQNEDLLDERLEELRLRDEKRRTDQLLGDSSATQEQPAAPIQGLALSNTQPQSQVVVSPVTDRPGQPAPQVAPVPTGAQAQQYAAGSPYTPMAQDQINMGQAGAVTTANASSIASSDDNKSSGFYISPRAGISSLSVNSSLSGVSATGLYSLGVAAGVPVSDNVSFEVGYTYSEYGISLGQMYMIPGLQQYNYQLNQSVIDALLKFYFLGPDSRLRPFVGAGGGYAMSSLSYPNQVTSYDPMLNNQSYNSNSFLGELAVGTDVKISKSVSVGAMFKYSDVLSSNQNNNNLYYYGGGYGYSGIGGYGYGGMEGSNAQQQLTGASLSQASFYSVLADLNVSF